MSSFFQIFSIDPIRLSLNPTELEKKFHELSVLNHPDRNGGTTDSVSRSAQINLAYKALRDPWARALYVLGQFGFTQGSKIPPSLADVYFELQEQQDPLVLSKFKLQLIEGRTNRLRQLEVQFSNFDKFQIGDFSSAQGDELQKNLKEIHNLVLENTYAASMIRDIEHRLGARVA